MNYNEIITINDKDITVGDLIEETQAYFETTVITNHISKHKVINQLKNHNYNPFLVKYIANYLAGEITPDSVARAMIYPRALGTSITTIFGNQMQQYINVVLGGAPSLIPGVDLEFVDKLDGHKKYCQLKSGPQTINKDDVEPIKQKFKDMINLGRTNGIRIHPDDCVLGVLYGDHLKKSAFYKAIDADYNVYMGKEFWHHLTGYENFFDTITDAVGGIASRYDASSELEEVIKVLSEEIAIQDWMQD